MPDRASWNAPRFDPASTAGHYESWYQRGNHPTAPLAFWIRYTIFAAKNRPAADAIGELWAIFFDARESPPRVLALRETRPITQCSFGAGALAKIGTAVLSADSLAGSATDGAHGMRWNLRYSSPEAPVLIMPERMYARAFPPAKSVVGSPNAVFDGTLDVDGASIAIEGWTGCQAHNWGTKQSEAYWFGQAGFPGGFLECISVRYRFGPLFSPRLTVFSLRVDGESFDCVGPVNGLRTRARASIAERVAEWRFSGAANGARVTVVFTAPLDRFAALGYGNPVGGVKRCLNTKIGDCSVTIERSGVTRTLSAQGRALLEILDDPQNLPAASTFAATAGQ